MAVYTDITEDDLRNFLTQYDVGSLTSYKGIAEGVENSNFLLHTTKDPLILTLYEKRVEKSDLPFFLGLMQHLAAKGLSCPLPLPRKDGELLGELSGRPAALISFLEGMWLRKPEAKHCREVGKALAAMHLAGEGFEIKRPNALSVEGWKVLWEKSEDRAEEVEKGLKDEIRPEIDYLAAHWPKDLPAGVIHADLFQDNVFFLGDELSGLIDFYFACNDLLAYDVSICLNAWCFEKDGAYNVTKGKALLEGYQSVRPLSEAELEALPLLARGSALRFFLTRLYDWLTTPEGALVVKKRPAGISAQAAVPPFHRHCRRIRAGRRMKHVDIFTDGACSGNPGPGGWGAVLRYGEVEKELCGGEAETTNNRMELMAAISALNALKAPCEVDLFTDSAYVKDGITKWIFGWKKKGWKTADNKPVKNIELWQALEVARERHKVTLHWVKGHAGHPENERADELARKGMEPFKRR